ncbi:hypothetical protein TNCV_3492951 [Trichonephila clavipes]|nr:hypothetical protein TNCV_3492951 [Trichonephila clavipes]
MHSLDLLHTCPGNSARSLLLRWNSKVSSSFVGCQKYPQISFFQSEFVEEVLHKYDAAASGQKNPGRPPTVEKPVRLTKRHFISCILPSPVKRELTRQIKVYCLKEEWKWKKLKGRKHDSGVMIEELL